MHFREELFQRKAFGWGFSTVALCAPRTCSFENFAEKKQMSPLPEMHPTFFQLKQVWVLGRSEADPTLQWKQTGFSGRANAALTRPHQEQNTLGLIQSYAPRGHKWSSFSVGKGAFTFRFENNDWGKNKTTFKKKELWASYIGCSLNDKGDSVALKSRRVRSFFRAWNPLLHAWHILFFLFVFLFLSFKPPSEKY